MDIHRKLIACSLILLVFMVVVEVSFPREVVDKWFWHPIPQSWLETPFIPFNPSTPGLIAIILLIVALFMKEE